MYCKCIQTGERFRHVRYSLIFCNWLESVICCAKYQNYHVFVQPSNSAPWVRLVPSRRCSGSHDIGDDSYLWADRVVACCVFDLSPSCVPVSLAPAIGLSRAADPQTWLPLKLVAASIVMVALGVLLQGCSSCSLASSVCCLPCWIHSYAATHANW